LATKIKHGGAAGIEANRPKRRVFVLFTFYWLQNSNTGTAAGIEAKNVLFLFCLHFIGDKIQRTKNILFCLHFSGDMARLQQHDKLAKKHKNILFFFLFCLYFIGASARFLAASSLKLVSLKQVPQSEFLKAP
jgi:hypothetical protein